MTRYLKLIGFLLLLAVFGQLSGNASVDETAVVACAQSGEPVTLHDDMPCFSSPQWQGLEEAERLLVNGMGGFSVLARLSRVATDEYRSALNACIGELMQRDTSLASQCRKRFDATPWHPHNPACAYYVFMLRKIII